MTLDKAVRAKLERMAYENYPNTCIPAAQALATDNVCKMLAMIIAELQMIRATLGAGDPYRGLATRGREI